MRIEDLDFIAIADEVKRRPALGSLLLGSGSFNIGPMCAREGRAIRAFLDRYWRIDLRTAPAVSLIEKPRFEGLPMATRLEGCAPLGEALAGGSGDHVQRIIDSVLVQGVNVGLSIAEDDLFRDVERTNALAIRANDIVGEAPGARFAELRFIPSHAEGPVSFVHEVEAVEAFLEHHFEIAAAPNDYEVYRAALADDPLFGFDRHLEFDGTPLHPKLRAGCLEFEEHMRVDQVLHDDLALGMTPLATMLAAIMRQGTNLALLVVDATYGATLAARRREAKRVLGGLALLEQVVRDVRPTKS